MNHISQNGIEEDEMGFSMLTCKCGETIGPAPDTETLVDMAMEHAYTAWSLRGEE